MIKIILIVLKYEKLFYTIKKQFILFALVSVSIKGGK